MMGQVFSFLVPVTLSALLLFFGYKAKKHRHDNNLSDMFIDAMKDKKYALYISAMFLTFCLLAFNAYSISTN